MNILITGVAGFIGYSLARRLLNDGMQVYGIDNLNPYYDVGLKKARLAQLASYPNFTFQYLDLSDHASAAQLFQDHSFQQVVHLAAQAGARYSLDNPWVYINSNITGFVNLLEGCRQSSLHHLVFASSSSVYGANTKVPFATTDHVDYPISLYAATKKSGELIAHTYSHLYGLPVTGLRFFTVYGPWGRPDMVYFKFVKAIAEDKPIDVYNYGNMKRDFTYIDDIVEGIVRVMHHPPSEPLSANQTHSLSNSSARYCLYNIGNNNPVGLQTFIQVIEQILGKKAILNFLPMQPGDVPVTYADVDDLMQAVGFKPTTAIETGMLQFIKWYQSYYQTKSI
jgi:UDP-glucuronate 4-epimerase